MRLESVSQPSQPSPGNHRWPLVRPLARPLVRWQAGAEDAEPSWQACAEVFEPKLITKDDDDNDDD